MRISDRHFRCALLSFRLSFLVVEYDLDGRRSIQNAPARACTSRTIELNLYVILLGRYRRDPGSSH